MQRWTRSAGPDKLGPTGVARPGPAAWFGVQSTGVVASIPPGRRDVAATVLPNPERDRTANLDQLSCSRVRRTQQNLSFVITPSR